MPRARSRKRARAALHIIDGMAVTSSQRGSCGAVRPPRRPARARRGCEFRVLATPPGGRPDPFLEPNRPCLPTDARGPAGIGKTIESKIVQIVNRGRDRGLTKRKAQIPAGVAKFLRLPALGPGTARRIWQELGITTVEELRKAAEAERLQAAGGWVRRQRNASSRRSTRSRRRSWCCSPSRLAVRAVVGVLTAPSGERRGLRSKLQFAGAPRR